MFCLFLVVSAAPGDNIHIHVTPRISRRKALSCVASILFVIQNNVCVVILSCVCVCMVFWCVVSLTKLTTDEVSKR